MPCLQRVIQLDCMLERIKPQASWSISAPMPWASLVWFIASHRKYLVLVQGKEEGHSLMVEPNLPSTIFNRTIWRTAPIRINNANWPSFVRFLQSISALPSLWCYPIYPFPHAWPSTYNISLDDPKFDVSDNNRKPAELATLVPWLSLAICRRIYVFLIRKCVR